MNEKLEKYINIINSHLDQKKGEENLDELMELFASAEFIEVIKSQRMDIYFESERKNKKDNKKVVDYLLGALGVLLRNEEAGNVNIEFFYFYLKGKRTKTESKNLFWFMSGIVLAVVIGYIGTQWHRVDAILFLAAPSKGDICEAVEERYDIKVTADDIQIQSSLNDDYRTNETYPKKVVYTIPVLVGNEQVTFSGTWVPFQELALDYEMVLVKEYLEEHSFHVTECEMSGSSFQCELAAYIADAESKAVFLQQFENALKDIFSNTYVTQQFRNYGFGIMMGEEYYDGHVYVTICKDSMSEDLEKLSDELDVQLGQRSELLEYSDYLE